MRHKKAVMIGFAVAGLLVMSWFILRPSSKLEWMQKTSGIHLPRDIKDVNVFDDREHLLTAHVQLPASSLEEFVRRYGFAPASKTNLFARIGMKNLEARFRTFPQNAELLMCNGESQQHSWIYVLDRPTGHLWFAVEYPSVMGGD